MAWNGLNGPDDDASMWEIEMSGIFILVARIDFAIASANWKRNFSVIWISTSLFWGGASVWSMSFRAFPKKNDHRFQAHLSNIAFHSRSILIHTRSGRLFSYASSFVLFFCFTSHSFIRIARTLYTKSTFIFFLSLLLWLANSCTWLYTSGPFCFVQFCIPNVHTFYLPYLLLFCSVFLYDELNVCWFCMAERPHRSLFGSEWQKLLSECIS